MTCTCTPQTQRLLREQNTVLIIPLFGGPPRAVVTTDKLDTKVRGRAKVVVAPFCPLCGEINEPQPAVAAPGSLADLAAALPSAEALDRVDRRVLLDDGAEGGA